ncbi:hypothetical protein OROMI_002891 [Orobanche minor]
MPLYDCMLLLKPNVGKEAVMDLVARVGKHICRRNGVVTDMKSFGGVQLGYGIKKLDGRYYQFLVFSSGTSLPKSMLDSSMFVSSFHTTLIELGKLVQLTMMTPPSFNSELYYLNKEDRLLRWLLVKHHEIKFGSSLFGEDDAESELRSFRSSLYEDESAEEDGDSHDDSELDQSEITKHHE